MQETIEAHHNKKQHGRQQQQQRPSGLRVLTRPHGGARLTRDSRLSSSRDYEVITNGARNAQWRTKRAEITVSVDDDVTAETPAELESQEGDDEEELSALINADRPKITEM